MIYEVKLADKTHRVDLHKSGELWECVLDGRKIFLDAISTQNGVLSLLIEGKSYEVKQENAGEATNIIVGNQRFAVELRDPRSLRSRRHSDSAVAGPRKITAPMPGKVVRILAPVGAQVELGQGILVIEAMKMQNELKSPKKGVVIRLNADEGTAVEAGQVLAEVE
jgi:biotin carboxyl carrier protein